MRYALILILVVAVKFWADINAEPVNCNIHRFSPMCDDFADHINW